METLEGITFPADSKSNTLIQGTREQLNMLRIALNRALAEGPPEEPWTVDALGWNGSERLAVSVLSTPLPA